MTLSLLEKLPFDVINHVFGFLDTDIYKVFLFSKDIKKEYYKFKKHTIKQKQV